MTKHIDIGNNIGSIPFVSLFYILYKITDKTHKLEDNGKVCCQRTGHNQETV